MIKNNDNNHCHSDVYTFIYPICIRIYIYIYWILYKYADLCCKGIPSFSLDGFKEFHVYRCLGKCSNVNVTIVFLKNWLKLPTSY